MKRVFGIGSVVIGTVAALLTVPAPAAATGITLYDAALVSPPGFYDGSGNPNGGFTINVNGGIELGLRAKYRQNPNVIDTPTNVYSVVAGAETSATNGGSPGVPGDAAWNYEFSINLQPGGADGTSGLSLAAISGSTITIQDLTAGTSSTQGLFSVFSTDDSFYGPSGKQAETLGEFSTDWGAQNSENPVFANFGVPFNMNNDDYYRISINLTDSNGAVLDSDSIDVSVGGATNPVPEPTSLVLLATGFLGFGIASRRRFV